LKKVYVIRYFLDTFNDIDGIETDIKHLDDWTYCSPETFNPIRFERGSRKGTKMYYKTELELLEDMADLFKKGSDELTCKAIKDFNELFYERLVTEIPEKMLW